MIKWQGDDRMDFSKIIENLGKMGYIVKEFDNVDMAVEYLSGEIKGCTVGIGGSVTVGEMGLYEELIKDNDVCWHDRKPEGMSVVQARKKANEADIYISSVNGIAETGEIINIDNTGNRVAAISYGPKKVYLLVGENKIMPTYEEALYRARNVAAPLNARRLNRKTPCAVNADRCYDCKSEERICRNLSVLWNKPTGAEYEVILIHAKLGF